MTDTIQETLDYERQRLFDLERMESIMSEAIDEDCARDLDKEIRHLLEMD